jgi:hypothetical protein
LITPVVTSPIVTPVTTDVRPSTISSINYTPAPTTSTLSGGMQLSPITPTIRPLETSTTGGSTTATSTATLPTTTIAMPTPTPTPTPTTPTTTATMSTVTPTLRPTALRFSGFEGGDSYFEEGSVLNDLY